MSDDDEGSLSVRELSIRLRRVEARLESVNSLLQWGKGVASAILALGALMMWLSWAWTTIKDMAKP